MWGLSCALQDVCQYPRPPSTTCQEHPPPVVAAKKKVSSHRQMSPRVKVSPRWGPRTCRMQQGPGLAGRKGRTNGSQSKVCARQMPFLKSRACFPNTCREYKGFGENRNFPKTGRVDLPGPSLEMCRVAYARAGEADLSIGRIAGPGPLSTRLSSREEELVLRHG